MNDRGAQMPAGIDVGQANHFVAVPQYATWQTPEQMLPQGTIGRQRRRIVQRAGPAIQQLQKALTTMNLRWTNASATSVV